MGTPVIVCKHLSSLRNRDLSALYSVVILIAPLSPITLRLPSNCPIHSPLTYILWRLWGGVLLQCLADNWELNARAVKIASLLWYTSGCNCMFLNTWNSCPIIALGWASRSAPVILLPLREWPTKSTKYLTSFITCMQIQGLTWSAQEFKHLLTPLSYPTVWYYSTWSMVIQGVIWVYIVKCCTESAHIHLYTHVG